METPPSLKEMVSCMAAVEHDPELSAQLFRHLTDFVLERDTQGVAQQDKPTLNAVSSIFMLIRSRRDSPELRDFLGAIAPLIEKVDEPWTPEAIAKVMIALQNLPVCAEVIKVYSFLKKPLEEVCAGGSSSSSSSSSSTRSSSRMVADAEDGLVTGEECLDDTSQSESNSDKRPADDPNKLATSSSIPHFSTTTLGQAVRGLRGPTEEASALWDLLSSEVEKCKESLDFMTMTALLSAATRMGGKDSSTSRKVIELVVAEARVALPNRPELRDPESWKQAAKLEHMLEALEKQEVPSPASDEEATATASAADAGAAAAAPPTPSAPTGAAKASKLKKEKQAKALTFGVMGGTLEEPLNEVLPEGWTVHRSGEQVYYHHPSVGSQWKRPNSKLPPGWEAHVGPDGKIFFYHEQYGSHWELPPV